MKISMKIFILVIVMMFAVTNIWWVNKISAQEPSLTAGSKVADINKEILESTGYMFADNVSTAITYTWPYTLGAITENNTAYGGTIISNLGQVSASLSMTFSGSYIAVAFCETYYAAKIIVTIDGAVAGNYTPFINDKAMSEKSGDSKIVFVKNDLPEGDHTIVITHEAAHSSGEDNIKADGNPYYDNDAYFDCFIVENEIFTPPASVELGANIAGYTDSVLDGLGYKAINSDNPGITYTWPYDLDSAKYDLGGRNLRFNLGQVGAELSCNFEGSYLAVVLAECYYAATVIISVDGEEIGSVTPHTNIITASDTAYKSKILFIKGDLGGGKHTLTIKLEAAHTTGEDNIKADGQAYYDNEAFFDSIIVQKNPDAENNPITDDGSSLIPTIAVVPVLLITVMISKRKRIA